MEQEFNYAQVVVAKCSAAGPSGVPLRHGERKPRRREAEVGMRFVVDVLIVSHGGLTGVLLQVLRKGTVWMDTCEVHERLDHCHRGRFGVGEWGVGPLLGHFSRDGTDGRRERRRTGCTAVCVRQGSKSSIDLLRAKRLNVRWSSVFGLVGSGMSISGSGRAVCGYENNLTNADQRWFAETRPLSERVFLASILIRIRRSCCARREAWLAHRAAVQRKTYGTTENLFISHPKHLTVSTLVPIRQKNNRLNTAISPHY